ncbi:MAG: hemerythrin domain-containing protein [Actinobacteria bacterium]|nr:hemerythrin domain-containing protein [Actinomycetota bacterium]
MLPIEPLMTEHRLVERLIALMEKEGDKIKEDKLASIDFIDNCIDFIKTYMYGCHYGKEEDILFRDLKNKKLLPEHAKILKELILEHKHVRSITTKLIYARNNYFIDTGDAANQIYIFEIYEYIKDFISFYPSHIKKEEKEFFLPCMDYFSGKEKEKMLDEFSDFDRKLIHEKYKEVIENMNNL